MPRKPDSKHAGVHNWLRKHGVPVPPLSTIVPFTSETHRVAITQNLRIHSAQTQVNFGQVLERVLLDPIVYYPVVNWMTKREEKGLLAVECQDPLFPALWLDCIEMHLLVVALDKFYILKFFFQNPTYEQLLTNTAQKLEKAQALKYIAVLRLRAVVKGALSGNVLDAMHDLVKAAQGVRPHSLVTIGWKWKRVYDTLVCKEATECVSQPNQEWDTAVKAMHNALFQ